MAVGDLHVFADGYRFYETLHGPMVMTVCVDCDGDALTKGRTDRINASGLSEDEGSTKIPSRCTGCFREAHGLVR